MGIADAVDVSRSSVIDLINRQYDLTSTPAAKGPLGPECAGEAYSYWDCCIEHRKLRNELDLLKGEACFVNQVIGFCVDTDGSIFSANWYRDAMKFFGISLEEVRLTDWYSRFLYNQGEVMKKKEGGGE